MAVCRHTYHSYDAISAGYSPGDHIREVVTKHSILHCPIPTRQQETIKLVVVYGVCSQSRTILYAGQQTVNIDQLGSFGAKQCYCYCVQWVLCIRSTVCVCLGAKHALTSHFRAAGFIPTCSPSFTRDNVFGTKLEHRAFMTISSFFFTLLVFLTSLHISLDGAS